MSKICSHFDTYYEKWHKEIGALCFLLCRHRAGANDVAFQTFLRLGGAKNPEIGEEEARILLFKNAIRLCDDFYLKKMRRMPKPAELQAQNLPFPITTPLYNLLCQPFLNRAALALRQFGFTDKEIGDLLGRTDKGTAKLLMDPNIGDWQEALESMKLTEDEALIMHDRIYERFSVRSVGVENFIHDARNAFDLALPYLAAAVFALCALAVWYVKKG